ncbi:hypothetical protein K1719_013759 [Acacia pycnantha]|nr:hypothetical protein K1719_013759 [Acacia pycnantha]
MPLSVTPLNPFTTSCLSTSLIAPPSLLSPTPPSNPFPTLQPLQLLNCPVTPIRFPPELIASLCSFTCVKSLYKVSGVCLSCLENLTDITVSNVPVKASSLFVILGHMNKLNSITKSARNNKKAQSFNGDIRDDEIDEVLEVGEPNAKDLAKAFDSGERAKRGNKFRREANGSDGTVEKLKGLKGGEGFKGSVGESNKGPAELMTQRRHLCRIEIDERGEL